MGQAPNSMTPATFSRWLTHELALEREVERIRELFPDFHLHELRFLADANLREERSDPLAPGETRPPACGEGDDREERA